jgi:hypothetical protein
MRPASERKLDAEDLALARSLASMPDKLGGLRREQAQLGTAMRNFAEAHPMLRAITWARDDLEEGRAGWGDFPEARHLERELASPAARAVLDAWGRLAARYDSGLAAITSIEAVVRSSPILQAHARGLEQPPRRQGGTLRGA